MSSQFYNNQIPQGWEAAIIGVCIETITPPSKLNTIEYGESGKFPIIDQSQDFICGWTDNEKKVLKISEPLIVFGDHTCVTKFVNFDFAQGADGIKILKSKKSLNPEFLYQLLQFDPIVPEMYKRHFSKLKGKKILYPKDKVEQEKIAQVLGDMDELISAKCELLGKKRAIKQAAAQHLLALKPHWHTATLGEICKYIKTGKLDANAMEENGEFPFFTCAKKVYRINKYNFDLEALLISGNGANVGYVHYYKGKFNAYQRTYVLSDFSCNIFYLKNFLDLKLQERIEKEVRSGNTPYITMDTLVDMWISFPNLSEQTKIAKILSDMDDEISALQDEIEKLKIIKQGAMDELLSGKIRLKG